MFKKILVPLDGSERAEEALSVVRHMAEGTGAQVTLFRAGDAPRGTVRRRVNLRRPVPIVGMSGAQPMGTISARPDAYVETRGQAIERREYELMEYLHQAGAPLAESGIGVKAAVRFGNVSREIVRFAEAGKFDAIVMAAHTRRHLRNTAHGATTERVIKSGVAPVVVVHSKKNRARRKRA